jgi:hypothetical protein
MVALVDLNGKVRPVAIAAEHDGGYRVARLSLRYPGLSWTELPSTPFARRTAVIPTGVDVPRSAALLVLGWLSDSDLALVDQAAGVRAGMIIDDLVEDDEVNE